MTVEKVLVNAAIIIVNICTIGKCCWLFTGKAYWGLFWYIQEATVFSD